MMNVVHLCDCMEFMKSVPDKYYELAIVDPPYRDTNQPTKDMRRNGSMESLQGRPSKKYFEELIRISKNQIIWGANNFQLPQFMGFVVWRKIPIPENFTMSMCELASLSKGLGTIAKVVEITPMRQDRIHPTQKPVALYKWLLQNYAKPGDKIFDSHVGSGSLRIACHDMGFDFEGCEIDKDYWEAQEKRYRIFLAQPNLFAPKATYAEQPDIF
jgi:site-specific DNA-methyltransferase (adenine-specific)